MSNPKPPSITARLSAWVQALFPHLRKTLRTNLALFLATLLLHTPPRPTLSAYARNLPLPSSPQAKLNRLWRFLHHPALQNPWVLTRVLLPLLAHRAAKGKLLPLLVDWTPLEDSKHQALVAALPLKGWALVGASPLPLAQHEPGGRTLLLPAHRLGEGTRPGPPFYRRPGV